LRESTGIIGGIHVQFDFCTISPAWWYAIEIGSLLSGACFGFILHWLFKGAGVNLDSSRLQTFTGGCLLPVLFGLSCIIGFNWLIPDDPCGGAFTPDANFVFLAILPLTVLSAIVVFWMKVWRR
jgi:cytochrome bd-type quinol oxidase subunit 2